MIIHEDSIKEFFILLSKAERLKNEDKEKNFDMIYKILNLFFYKKNYKNEKQFLQHIFIKKNISEESFIINLCSLIKHFYDNFILDKSTKFQNNFSLLRNPNEISFQNLIENNESPCIKETKNDSENIKTTSNNLLKNKSSPKCLNNEINQTRNDLIVRSTRGNVVEIEFSLSSIDKRDNITLLKFVKPTSPIINCSIDSHLYFKYNFRKEEAKESRIQSNLNKSELNYEYNLNIFISGILVDWLIECYIIKRSEKSAISIVNILSRCKTGVLIADIINFFEGKQSPIKGIDRTNLSLTNNKMNVRKVCEFLRNKGKINRRFLFDEEKISEGDQDTIIGLLYDMYLFYKKKNVQITRTNSFNSFNNKGIRKKEKSEKLKESHSSNICFNSTNNKELSNTNKKSYATEKFLILDSPYLIKSSFNDNKIVDKSSLVEKNIYNSNCTVSIKPLEKPYLTRYKSLNNKEFMITRNKQIASFSEIYSPQKNNSLFSSVAFQDTITNGCLSNGSSPRQDTNEIKEIKYWLKSIGIKFADKINFLKSPVEEFKDGLLFIEIINNLDSTNKILFQVKNYPKSKAEALDNIRKALSILEQNKKSIPFKYLNCEEDIYNADSNFILDFLKVLRKVYQKENEFNLSLNEKQFVNSTKFSWRSKTPIFSVRSFDRNIENKPHHFDNQYSYKKYININANKKDNSRRKFYSPCKSAKEILIMNPRYAWN